MNKRFRAALSGILVLFITSEGLAQQNVSIIIDSLVKVIHKSPVDSTNANAAIEISSIYLEKGRYDYVKQYGFKSLELSDAISYKKGIARGNYYIGYGLGAAGQYDSTKIYFDRAEKILQEIRDTIDLASLYNSYSILYNFQSDYHTATAYLLKAANLLEKSNTQALRIKQIEIYGNLGLNLISENQLEKGIDYVKKALTLAVTTEFAGVNRYKTLLCNYIADANIKLKNFSEARKYLDSAIALAALLKNPVVEAVIVNTEAFYFQSNNEPSKALATYLKALGLTDSTGDKKVKAEVSANIAQLYTILKNYPEAEKYAIIATTLGPTLKLLKVTAQGYEVLKNVSAHRNDYKNALRFAELQKQYADSATNSETQKTTLTLEARYQGKVKENEIAALTLSNREKELAVLKRNRLIVTGGITAVALLLLTGLLFRNSRQQQIIAQKEQKLQQEHIKFLERQQQLVSLQSMVNGQETERTRIAKDLHDGLGGLFSTIKMYFSTLSHEQPVLKGNELFEKSYQLIDTASEEVRRIAHNMMPEVLMKLGLIPALNDMCVNISTGRLLQVKLQSYGMDKRMNASTEIML